MTRLTRYWFNVPGLSGFGVTAFSVEDAFFLLEAEGYLIDRDADIIVDIDVSTLDANHVLPNAGPACFRGVWFPCLNIGWIEPGAHHPSRGGNIKAAPPFVCGIRVGELISMKYPAILVLTGASGAGKTTLTLKLNELGIPGVQGINCDRVKLEADETSDPGDHQAAILRHWISQLSRAENEIKIAVLDTQIRPHRALEVLNQTGIEFAQIVLVDCDPIVRNERLHLNRCQPELANPKMDCWAAYLRGQADALNLSIIDTSADPIEKSLQTLEIFVKDLLNRKSRN